MNIQIRLCALMLSLTLLFSLAACSAKSGSEDPAPSDTVTDPVETPDSTETPDSILPDDFTADTSAEDICLAVTGIPGTFELLTVNGVPVTAYSYVYALVSTISYLENNIYSIFGSLLDWTTDETLVQYVKENALLSAARYSLIPSKAKELGYELSDAQLSELEASLALTVEYMGGDEAFRDELRKSAMDYDTFYNLNAASYYYAMLKDGLFAGRPNDADMDAYIEENDILLAKHILLMTVDSSTREPLDEATIAQKKASAEDILARLQASSDLEADFDALMHEYSEDPGLAYNPDGYTFTAGEMVAEFEDATRALEFGQISGIVESASTGYHIILRLDPDNESTRAECLTSLMNSQFSTWIEEADIVGAPELEALDIPMFYAKYAAYQSAFAQENAAES